MSELYVSRVLHVASYPFLKCYGLLECYICSYYGCQQEIVHDGIDNSRNGQGLDQCVDTSGKVSTRRDTRHLTEDL